LRDDAAWYLWHAQLTQGFFAAAAAAAQLLVHRQIIWAKNHFILGHGDFHWQHELCFYGWRAGHRARWFGDRSQSTIWEIDRPSAATSHPTEKPVEIFARSMRLSTKAGEICYEPFAGSGTQLCAAETEKRTCYAIEIEPRYVAVALERMSEMGLTAKLSDA
jgi:DNA modification methylase